MEQTKESDLLELQELALKQRISKSQVTLEDKSMIVKAHLLNHVPISQLSKDFGINKVTIWRWIRTFVSSIRNDRTEASEMLGQADLTPRRKRKYCSAKQ